MAVIRNLLLAGLGLIAMKMVKRMVENAEAQRVKVKTKADEAANHVQKLYLDPVTGVYRPEV